MRGEMKGHVEGIIQAWLDGELGAEEAETVREHLAVCESCSKALEESKAVLRALSADAQSGPIRPMWPAVKARISPSREKRFGLSFGLATSLAAAAGLAIGISLGSMGGAPQESYDADSEYTGSILDSDDILSLDQMYVAAFEKDGEKQ